MAEAAERRTRAGKTRNAILEAAEELFAERGFEGTRLEDIAGRVGIRRASIVYYFRDKRELYGAVIESVLLGLRDAIERAIAGDLSPADKIEAAISAWVDYVGARPTTAQFILRESADANAERGFLHRAQPVAELVRREFLFNPEVQGAGFANIDPIHLASTIAGSTVFFVSAVPALLPHYELQPTRHDQLEEHKRELLGVVRRLLGTRGPRRS